MLQELVGPSLLAEALQDNQDRKEMDRRNRHLATYQNQKVLIDTRGFEMSRGLQFPPGISVTHQPFLDYLRMLIHEGTQKATTPS